MKYSSSSMYNSVTAREGTDPDETGCRLSQHRRQQHGSTRRRPSHCAVVAGEHNSSTSGVGSVVTKVARLPAYQHKTHTSLMSNFSARGTAVVVSVKFEHRTSLGLSCCRQCSRGTPNSGEQATQATTRGNSNGSDSRDTRADKRPGSFRSQYTRGAHSNHYPASLRTYDFASLSSFLSWLPESLGRGPNRVYCCLTSTCAIRQRQRGQWELEGAMVRATIQTHSRVACSPGCVVDPKDQRIPVEIVSLQQQYFCVVIWDPLAKKVDTMFK